MGLFVTFLIAGMVLFALALSLLALLTGDNRDGNLGRATWNTRPPGPTPFSSRELW